MQYSSPRVGLEPTTDDSQQFAEQALTTSGDGARTKYVTECAADTLVDADLAAIIEAWPTLPEAIKVGVIAMVNVSSARK